MFNFFFGTSKVPNLEQLETLLRNLNAEIQCLSDRWRQQLILFIAYMLIKCLTKTTGQ